MRELADILAKIGAIHVSFDKPYDHGKGKTFPFYCDTRLLLAHPEARTKVVKALMKLMENRRPDAIIAVATGGIAHGAWLAGELAIPFGYVRCQAKGHGMKRSIEGYQQKDASVLIVEDVISRGTALNQALDGIGEHFKPLGALCLFDYGFAATKRRLDQRKLPVWSLVSFDDLIHAAHRHGLVDQAGLKRLQRHWEEAM